MLKKTGLIAIIFIANYGVPSAVDAQNIPKSSNATAHAPTRATPAAPPACLGANTLKAAQLHGLWTAVFAKPPAGLPSTATLQLHRHAEFSDSLAGTVSRNLATAGSSAAPAGHAPQAYLAGDLEAGMLLLDESSDNLSITGTWNGELVGQSCGNVFKGSWRDTSSSAPENAADVAFTLTRQR